jgi:hypothetical protein
MEMAITGSLPRLLEGVDQRFGARSPGASMTAVKLPPYWGYTSSKTSRMWSACTRLRAKTIVLPTWEPVAIAQAASP